MAPIRPATTKPTPEANPIRKILVHGSPGTGKTPLITSLPWGPVWGEKAVYVPCDRKEQNLAGVLPHNRERLITANYAECTDPFSFVKNVLEYDWRSEGAGTVIIDTGTNLARDYLAAAISSGGYNTKAITFGKEILKLADKPHYGLAHQLMARTVEAVKKCSLNVIMAFWSDYQEPQDGGIGAFGGPVTINMNFSRDIAGEFGTIIYTKTSSENGKTQYNAHTENHGIWVARLAGVLPNPCPVIKMEVDPVNVWNAIDAVQQYGG